MPDSQKPPRNNKFVWVGVLSSIVTIALTISNAYTKATIDAADQRLKEKTQEIDTRFRDRSTTLEESKERTNRYAFVHTLLPELSAKEATRRELAINLIRLTLKDEESVKFFDGFSKSGSENLQNASKTAINIISKERNDLQTASEKEREGFKNLIEGNYDNAIKAFEASEGAYPTYHQVYELAKLVRLRQQDLSDSNKKKEVFQLILSSYSYGAPIDLLEKVRAIALK